MKKLYVLEPEVAGGWGPGTVVTNQPQLQSGEATIPEVARLEYRFDGWLGDELLAASPCYIVTDNLAAAVRDAGLRGAHLEPVEVTTSDEWDQWRLLSPEIVPRLPGFQRLRPEGQVGFTSHGGAVSWSGHDVCLGTRVDYVKPARAEDLLDAPPPYGLVVTERCLRLLQQYRIDHCDVEELMLKG